MASWFGVKLKKKKKYIWQVFRNAVSSSIAYVFMMENRFVSSLIIIISGVLQILIKDNSHHTSQPTFF